MNCRRHKANWSTYLLSEAICPQFRSSPLNLPSQARHQATGAPREQYSLNVNRASEAKSAHIPTFDMGLKYITLKLDSKKFSPTFRNLSSVTTSFLPNRKNKPTIFSKIHSSHTHTHREISSTSTMSIEGVIIPRPIALALQFAYYLLMSCGFLGAMLLVLCLICKGCGRERPIIPIFVTEPTETESEPPNYEEACGEWADLESAVDADKDFMRRLY